MYILAKKKPKKSGLPESAWKPQGVSGILQNCLVTKHNSEK